LLRSFVADHRRFFAALTADTLIGSAGNDLFFPGAARLAVTAGQDVCVPAPISVAAKILSVDSRALLR
jgi:hypothetical protein